MPKNTLLLTAAAALAFVVAGPAAAQESPAPEQLSASEVETAVIKEMNRIRTGKGRVALKTHAILTSAARGHSAFLLDADLFQHEDSRGRQFWERVLEAGYPGYRRLSENLVQVSGCTTDTARQAVSLWMTSAPHRANLLDKKIRFVGVGVAATSDCSVVDITADHGS
jgi:uncharacterized protein YkwD